MSSRRALPSLDTRRKETIELLQLMRDHKESLFASFSPTLTNEMKQAAWRQVFDDCAASGHSWTAGRDEDFLRISMWQQLRVGTMKKIDNSRKTGSAGGESAKLNEVDNLVLDLLGADSPAIVGIDVAESMALAPAPAAAPPLMLNVVVPGGGRSYSYVLPSGRGHISAALGDGSSSSDSAGAGASTPQVAVAPPRPKHPRSAPVATTGDGDDDELRAIKKEYYKDLSTGQKLLNYKHQLEIIKLERELHLEHQYPL